MRVHCLDRSENYGREPQGQFHAETLIHADTGKIGAVLPERYHVVAFQSKRLESSFAMSALGTQVRDLNFLRALPIGSKWDEVANVHPKAPQQLEVG